MNEKEGSFNGTAGSGDEKPVRSVTKRHAVRAQVADMEKNSVRVEYTQQDRKAKDLGGEYHYL